MREYLFRGKREDNGEWVYGYFEKYNGRTYINLQTERLNTGGYPIREFVEVIPETIGQYTELVDKNGNKVFGGDIVRFSTAHAREIKYIDGCFGFEGSSIPIKYVNKFEVIGNIHDNPELLEVE